MNDDTEERERYFRWRRARTRAARRRWIRRLGIAVALIVAVIGPLMWLAQNRRVPRNVALTPPTTGTADPSMASPEPAPPQSQVSPAVTEQHTPAPAHRMTRSRARSPRASVPDAAVDRQSVTKSSSAAPPREYETEPAPPITAQESVATPEPAPPITARESVPPPAVAAVPPHSASPDAPAASGATASGNTPIAAAPVPGADESRATVAPDVAAPSADRASQNASATAGDPRCGDLTATLQGDSSVDGRSRKQRIVSCVGGWLKGESQEFRNGVTREIEEFRTGIDNVGRGLQWLGDKLRRGTSVDR